MKKNVIFLFFSVFIEYSYVFAQPKWKTVNYDPIAGKSELTYFQKIDDYPFKEFRIDTLDTTDYFNCDLYNYFSDTTLPLNFLTTKDSLELKRYSKKYHEIANNYGGYFAAYKQFLIPFIDGTYDTIWAERTCDTSFKYKSLSNNLINTVITTDAVFKGKVIAKRYPRDTTKCLHFKTEYIIEVEDVIHSYFILNKGDKILAKDSDEGYQGGCSRSAYNPLTGKWESGKDFLQVASETTRHTIGQEGVFSINRNYYQVFSLTSKNYLRDDVYCPQAFSQSIIDNYPYGDILPENKIIDLKDFFQNVFNKNKK